MAKETCWDGIVPPAVMKGDLHQALYALALLRSALPGYDETLNLVLPAAPEELARPYYVRFFLVQMQVVLPERAAQNVAAMRCGRFGLEPDKEVVDQAVSFWPSRISASSGFNGSPTGALPRQPATCLALPESRTSLVNCRAEWHGRDDGTNGPRRASSALPAPGSKGVLDDLFSEYRPGERMRVDRVEEVRDVSHHDEWKRARTSASRSAFALKSMPTRIRSFLTFRLGIVERQCGPVYHRDDLLAMIGDHLAERKLADGVRQEERSARVISSSAPSNRRLE